jgi:hypothetical protein
MESQCDSSLPQRAFSAMKLIKNYLRNTMTDERLSALALMYIHPQIDINIEELTVFWTNPLSDNSCNKLTGICIVSSLNCVSHIVFEVDYRNKSDIKSKLNIMVITEFTSLL